VRWTPLSCLGSGGIGNSSIGGGIGIGGSGGISGVPSLPLSSIGPGGISGVRGAGNGISAPCWAGAVHLRSCDEVTIHEPLPFHALRQRDHLIQRVQVADVVAGGELGHVAA